MPSPADSQAPTSCAPPALQGYLRGRVPVRVLVDSGATSDFVSASLVAAQRLAFTRSPGTLTLANGQTTTTPGYLPKTHLIFGDYQVRRSLLITDLGDYDVILGQPWLREARARIDWAAGSVTVTTAAGRQHTLTAAPGQRPSTIILDSISSFKRHYNPAED
ncbi:MAG: retropepsin-like aspartic protease, partial [Caldilineaceae bacterium]